MNGILRKYFSGFAMEYGTYIGLTWVVVFGLYVWGLRTLNPLLLLVAMLAWVALPIPAFLFAHRFRQQLTGEALFGYGRAYCWCMVTLSYACLLTGAVEWAYFKFWDGGALLAQMTDFMTASEIGQTYKALGMGQTFSELEATLEMLGGLSPLDLAMMLLNQNIFTSLLLAVPMAFFARVPRLSSRDGVGKME